jgi:hypothetical protein
VQLPSKLRSSSFGPYDNAYLLLGCEDGTLLGIDATKLEPIFRFQVSNDPIVGILIDPAHTIVLVCGDEMQCLTLSPNEVQYIYMEFGDEQFCTVELEKRGMQSFKLDLRNKD